MKAINEIFKLNSKNEWWLLPRIKAFRISNIVFSSSESAIFATL